MSVLVRSVVGPLTAREIGLLALFAVVMTGGCMLAGLVPTRRALGIEPTEASREEA